MLVNGMKKKKISAAQQVSRPKGKVKKVEANVRARARLASVKAQGWSFTFRPTHAIATTDTREREIFSLADELPCCLIFLGRRPKMEERAFGACFLLWGFRFLFSWNSNQLESGESVDLLSVCLCVKCRTRHWVVK